jgi:D-alanine-D-alanine ligase
MSSPRILLLYNEPVLPAGHPDRESEVEILITLRIINDILVEAGFRTEKLGVGTDPSALLTGLGGERPDLVFNLFEGLADDPGTESTVTGLLEWFGVPFTGSPSAALTLARDKLRTKYLLQGAGLPTPAFHVVERLPCPPCTIPWPVIVKPALQDASVGIEQASVVVAQEELEQQVAVVLDRFGPPVLVERFVHGREFHAAVIEEPDADTGEPAPRMLPLAEIVFDERDASYWPIYSYDAKWREGTHEWEATPLISPVHLAPPLMERLGDICCRAFRLVGCRDYARVDVRMTASGEFFILEVNPNPFINSVGMVNALAAMGRTHPAWVVDLVKHSLARCDRGQRSEVRGQ